MLVLDIVLYLTCQYIDVAAFTLIYQTSAIHNYPHISMSYPHTITLICPCPTHTQLPTHIPVLPTHNYPHISLSYPYKITHTFPYPTYTQLSTHVPLLFTHNYQNNSLYYPLTITHAYLYSTHTHNYPHMSVS